ncbi:DUF2062 domain-containing protein [Idiomarina seosinensis]|uniref:DUF2062 domain-containing protein n=1 Tax=Idiomarina seosinensis TaxID=281739 RepID=A0A432ZKP9_9GAMM|nr:DUF2062 domain-containing protein [Idiomarina seosinensis]RUO77802.1 DUF2062 domain-containing protein [Idiomarina seosinensis]
MARRVIKKLVPNHETIRQTKVMRLFGSLLHDANLWHLNRRSASGAFAVGLFTAFIPVPFQMVLAAAVAIPFRVNLPLSVGLVWISNPITMPPMFYLAYRLGNWLLAAPPQPFSFELSWTWLIASISTIGPSLLLGCLVLGTLASLTGYLGIRLLWRQSVVRAWRRRPGSRHSG